MKGKQETKTKDINKWKAHLNLYGSRMKKGIYYEQTHVPVASWN